MEDQGEALLDQEEEQPVDSMEPLVCGEGDIVTDSLLSTSQLVVVVNNSTQDPVVCPPQDAETERTLQPDVSLVSWMDHVDQRGASLHEQSSEEPEGPGAQVILYSPVETSEQVVSGDGVNTSSNHSQPDNIQDTVLEAQCRASLQVTLNRFSRNGSRPQGESTRSLGFVGECMLWEWYQPGRKSVWSEDVAFHKLEGLKLTSEQQSAVDSGIRLDQSRDSSDNRDSSRDGSQSRDRAT